MQHIALLIIIIKYQLPYNTIPKKRFPTLNRATITKIHDRHVSLPPTRTFLPLPPAGAPRERTDRPTAPDFSYIRAARPRVESSNVDLLTLFARLLPSNSSHSTLAATSSASLIERWISPRPRKRARERTSKCECGRGEKSLSQPRVQRSLAYRHPLGKLSTLFTRVLSLFSRAQARIYIPVDIIFLEPARACLSLSTSPFYARFTPLSRQKARKK